MIPEAGNKQNLMGFFQEIEPTEPRSPKKHWVSNSEESHFTERGPLGFGPIQFLMEFVDK